MDLRLTPPLTRFVAVLVTAAVLVLGLGSGSPAHAANRLTRIGHAPRLPAGASAAGALPQTAKIDATVTLQPQDPSALATYAQSVSTPGSPDYHHYLSVDQFAQRFAPSAAEVAAVRDGLRAQGLNPGPLGANGLSLDVTASAAKLSSAFSTAFERYHVPGGRTAFANTSAPAVPASIAGLVQGVVGLDSLQLPTPAGLVKQRAVQPRLLGGQAAPQPNTTAPGETAGCSSATGSGRYTAGQIASAYGFSDLYTAGDAGAGTTIAVFELEPYSATDTQAYQTCYGTATTVTNVPVDGGSGTGSGSGEAALDVEDLIGLAPGAAIKVYEGPNTAAGSLQTYNTIVTQSGAQVVSTSWGLCETAEGSSAAQAENTLFQEAAAQGQSIFAASGDSGVQDCVTTNPASRVRAVDDPASQPFVTAVGGTTLSTPGPPPAETAWNSTWGSGRAAKSGAGGGGVSGLWGQPSYQAGLAVSQTSTTCGTSGSTTCREVPDVSADADLNTGYSIYFKGQWSAFGGTSAAAPTWAALAALADSSVACAANPVGFVNTALYQAAAAGYSTYFNDVTSGNNTYGGVTGFTAATGYDLASGLGSPKGAALAADLCNAQASNTFTTPTTTTASTTSTTPTTTDSAPTTTDPAPTTTDPAPTTVLPPTIPPTATTASPPIVRFSRPKAQTARVGQRVVFQLRAADSAGLRVSYRAAGLPAGLSLARSTGLISGTPSRAWRGPVTVVATDSRGSSAVVVFVWTVAGQPKITGLLRLDGAGRPSLSVRVIAGTNAPGIRTIIIAAPTGVISFSRQTGALATGVVIRDASGHRLGVAQRLSDGALVVTLRNAPRAATIRIAPPAISISQQRAALIRRSHGAAVRVKITVKTASA
jgi:hypothetical protein